MILITGSTGNTGRELRRLLRNSGHPSLSMARRPEALRSLQDEGYDAVHGDFDDPESLRGALRGVNRAFLVCTPDEKLLEREIGFIDAAQQAGVQRIVKISALMADPEAPSPNLKVHGLIESHLKSSGLEYTLLQANGFMQTFFWMVAPAIEAQGALACPAGDGRCALVDVRDVAKAAWVALTDDKHRDQTYQLTGPESLDMKGIAQQLSTAMGRAIPYVDMPEEPMMQAMRGMGVSENSVQHVAAVFRMIRSNALGFTTETLRELGIEPTTWQQCATDLSAGATQAATSFHQPAS